MQTGKRKQLPSSKFLRVPNPNPTVPVDLGEPLRFIANPNTIAIIFLFNSSLCEMNGLPSDLEKVIRNILFSCFGYAEKLRKFYCDCSLMYAEYKKCFVPNFHIIEPPPTGYSTIQLQVPIGNSEEVWRMRHVCGDNWVGVAQAWNESNRYRIYDSGYGFWPNHSFTDLGNAYLEFAKRRKKIEAGRSHMIELYINLSSSRLIWYIDGLLEFVHVLPFHSSKFQQLYLTIAMHNPEDQFEVLGVKPFRPEEFVDMEIELLELGMNNVTPF